MTCICRLKRLRIHRAALYVTFIETQTDVNMCIDISALAFFTVKYICRQSLYYNVMIYCKATQGRFADYHHHFSNISSGWVVIIHYSLAINFSFIKVSQAPQ